MLTTEEIRRKIAVFMITRATAHTVQSVNAHPVDTERLRLYWTKNPEGLAKWADKPHPWTALREQLAKYIHNPEELNRVTSAWHFSVFHQHTGSDAYRIEHGGQKRGSKIGPG